MKKFLHLTLIILISLLAANAIAQEAGQLDPNFAGDGIELYDPGDQHDNGYSIIALADTSMLICGTAKIDGETAGILMKILANGDIDMDYGTDGVVSMQFGEQTYPYAMIQTDDGHFLISGLCYTVGYNSEMFLAKVDVNGDLVTSFGDDGVFYTDYTGDEEVCETMALQEDGKIVLAGRTYSGSFSQLLFTRVNADGTLDEDFGTDGYTEIDASSQDEHINSLGILSNGTIVGVGFGFQGNPMWGDQVFIAKLHADGTPMTGFGNDGVIVPSIFNDISVANNVQVIGDSLLITGFMYDESDLMNLFLTKLDSSGVVDPAFADDGINLIYIEPMNVGLEIILDGDNKIYVGGTSGQGAPGDSEFIILRYLNDGSFDNSFDDDGYVMTDIRSDWDEIYSMDFQVDGKIIATGMSGGLTNSGDNKLPVVRYYNDWNPFGANFISSSQTVCVGSSVDFFDASSGDILTWDWEFEGGNPATSTDQNPTVTYTSTGTFDVELTVSDGTNYDTKTELDYITVIDTPDKADTPDGEETLCSGNFYEYTTNEVVFAETYEWELSPASAGVLTPEDTTVTLDVDADFTGDITLKVRATNFCGDGEWSDYFEGTVYESPEEFALEGGGGYCIGDEGVEITLDGSQSGISYELYLDGQATGIVVDGTGSAISFGLITDEGYYISIASNDNCETTMQNQVEVSIAYPPLEPATPTGPVIVCADTTTTYESAGVEEADSYVWGLSPDEAGTITGDGLEASVEWSPDFSGTAMVTLYGINDCGDGNSSEALEVEVNGIPMPVIVGESLVCDNHTEDYMVTENDGSTYVWTVTGGTISAGDGTYMVSVEWGEPGIGTVDVEELTATGCDGISETFDVLIDDCTAISEDVAANEMIIYPNPVNSQLKINTAAQLEGTAIVFDLTGKQLMEQNFEGGNQTLEVNTSALNSGLYLIRIQYSDGSGLTKRFIKE